MTDSVLDQAALDALLETVGGDRDFLAELIDTFFDDTAVLLPDLHQALADGDSETFRRIAHSLKTNSASFGAMTLSALCKELEDRGKAGDLAGSEGDIDVLEGEYARVKEALEVVKGNG